MYWTRFGVEGWGNFAPAFFTAVASGPSGEHGMESKLQRDRAEGELIDLVRRHSEQNFRLTVLCDKGRWSVSMTVPESELRGTIPYIGWLVGTGASFTEAWTNRQSGQPFRADE